MTIFLIGMPGVGKSTLGQALSQQMAMPFVDTDDLIAQTCGQSLQDFKNEFGYLALRKLEQDVLLTADFSNKLVATGGSVVYGDRAMKKLRDSGLIVYLQISLETMMGRVTNQDSRGLAIAQGMSLEDLYRERCPLYEKYAMLTVDVNATVAEQALKRVTTALSAFDPALFPPS